MFALCRNRRSKIVSASMRRYVAAARGIRWTLCIVAVAALAACDASSMSASTGTTSGAAIAAKPGGSSTQTTSVTVTSSAPSVTLTAGPTTVPSGGSAKLSWSSTNASACTASGGWSGPVGTSGTWSTGAMCNTTDYELTCTGAGGSATQSAIVTVVGLGAAVTLSASPSTIDSGDAATLTWSSSGAATCSASGAWSGVKPANGSQSTGPLAANSTYTLTCAGTMGQAEQSATVSVKPAAPTVSLSASPSTLAGGTSSTLRWSAVNATSCDASGDWAGPRPLNGLQSTGVLTAAATYTLTCAGPGGTAAQSATVSVKSPAPSVSLSVGPSAVASGGSATLNWSATDAVSCIASGGWSGAKGIKGSQSTGALRATTIFTLTCSGSGGSAAQSAEVTVSAHPTVTVAFNASPSTVASRHGSILTWASTGATTCAGAGAWSGAKSLSGSQSTGNLAANATYILTCSGNGGGNATQSVTVSVTAPAPSIVISASPSTVASGSDSTLAWSSVNATSCTGSGAWVGGKALSGSQSTGAMTADETYTLRCSGAGGTAVQSATVSVTKPAPTVSLAASPSTIPSGGSSTLAWSTINATSCTASGAWAGSKADSGSASTGVLTVDETYTLTCSGAGGSAAQSATVSIAAPAPSVSLAAPQYRPEGRDLDPDLVHGARHVLHRLRGLERD